MNASFRRGERSCSALATSSLPVPLSPWIRTVLETGAICSILTSTSWIGALSPTMPVRSCRWRRSISRRAVSTASSGDTGLVITSVARSRSTRSVALGVGRLQQGEGGDLGVVGQRGELLGGGSCTAPVRIIRSGFSRRTVPRASSREENMVVENFGRLERGVEPDGGLEVVHGDEDLRGHGWKVIGGTGGRSRGSRESLDREFCDSQL